MKEVEEEMGCLERLAKTLLHELVPFIKINGKEGGFLTIATVNGGILRTSLIGKVSNEEKRGKYDHLSQEKAKRLGKHRTHLSSWQSRDEAKKCWGGAIRVNRVIFSFSGFPEDWDEVFVLLLALRYWKIDSDLLGQITDIIAKSRNPHAWKLIHEEFGKHTKG